MQEKTGRRHTKAFKYAKRTINKVMFAIRKMKNNGFNLYQISPQ